MKKLKLYLDTSVISYLDQKESPEKTAETRLFWEKIKAGEFEVCISRVALQEINRCIESKKNTLLAYLNEIDYDFLEISQEIEMIARRFIERRILTAKNIDDCRHIAASIVSQCDIIVSWNFKHIVNYRTINGVKLVSLITGYKEVAIYSPEMLNAGGFGEGELF